MQWEPFIVNQQRFFKVSLLQALVVLRAFESAKAGVLDLVDTLYSIGSSARASTAVKPELVFSTFEWLVHPNF